MSSLDGDIPCADCGTTSNIIWFTDDVLWNAICHKRGFDGILCIRCFVKWAERAGCRPNSWRLLPNFAWQTEAQD